MNDSSNLRNLEQLQEEDSDDRRTPRGVTITLVVLGGGCIVFAGLALIGRTSQPQVAKADPLGELVAQHGRTPGRAPAPDRPTSLRRT
jgi:hypothetical protein